MKDKNGNERNTCTTTCRSCNESLTDYNWARLVRFGNRHAACFVRIGAKDEAAVVMTQDKPNPPEEVE